MQDTNNLSLYVWYVSKFKIYSKHMLVSSRHFPIGNACNNNFKLQGQELFSNADKINPN